MLHDHDVHADVAVKDLVKAKKFYAETLGLTQTKENEQEVYYGTGSKQIKIYQSQFAGSNKATYASWVVDDVAAAVNELKSKGVAFEQYDFPGVKHEGDVHVMGNMRAAWFKDPDGNIFCIGNDGE
jgi:extradiol dioxygenase family protein